MSLFADPMAADQTGSNVYDEAGGRPDPATAIQMVASGQVYGTSVPPGTSMSPEAAMAFANQAYANQFKVRAPTLSRNVMLAVALGLAGLFLLGSSSRKK